MPEYAHRTKVPAEKTRLEIEALMKRRGGTAEVVMTGDARDEKRRIETTKLELTPASELSQIRPRPQPIDLRIGLAIHWALSKHGMPVSDADRKKLKLTVKGLAATFQRELGHVGLKLVWADGATPLGVQE